MEVSETVNTNSGDESEGLFAGCIEYKNLFILLGGLALTLVLTLTIWHNRNVAPVRCFVVGSLPFLITCLWVFGFRQGKPKAHDRDLLQTALTGKGWDQDPEQPFSPVQDQPTKQPKFAPVAPNGWICEGLVLWGCIRKGGYTSKGFVVDVPTQSQSSPAIRNSLNAAIRRFLHTLDEQTRAQLYWSVDSDYKDALAAYDKTTQSMGNQWSRHVRKERHSRYFKAMLDGKLRRERLVLYLSRPITVDPPASLSGERLLTHYEQVLAEENHAFHQKVEIRDIATVDTRRIDAKDSKTYEAVLIRADNNIEFREPANFTIELLFIKNPNLIDNGMLPLVVRNFKYNETKP